MDTSRSDLWLEGEEEEEAEENHSRGVKAILKKFDVVGNVGWIGDKLRRIFGKAKTPVRARDSPDPEKGGSPDAHTLGENRERIQEPSRSEPGGATGHDRLTTGVGDASLG
jgi:hypothetical protein